MVRLFYFYGLLLSLALFILGCGSNQPSFTQDGESPQAGPGIGNLQLQNSVRVPSEERDSILRNKEAIETLSNFPVFRTDTRGRFVPEFPKVTASVAEDGSAISFGPIIPGGWLIKAGDKATLIEANGNFHLDIPEGVEDAFLFMPHNFEVPVYRVAVEDLRGDLTLSIGFDGPCGEPPMSPELCGSTPSPQQSEPPRGRIEREGVTRQLAMNTDDGAFGTYPDRDQFGCRQEDGNTGRFGQFGLRELIGNYIGSTCWQLVQSGCCNGEGGAFSTVLFQRVIGKTVSGQELGVPPAISCYINHKGRYCQEVNPMDLVISANGHICGPGEAATSRTCPEIVVSPGEVVPIIVHNNGCYGETATAQILREIRGTLNVQPDTQAPFDPNALTIEEVDTTNEFSAELTGSVVGAKSFAIRHYNKALHDIAANRVIVTQSVSHNKNIYVTDRVLHYTVPEDAVGPARDKFTFATDGVAVGITFFLPATPPPTPSPTPSSTPGPSGLPDVNDQFDSPTVFIRPTDRVFTFDSILSPTADNREIHGIQFRPEDNPDIDFTLISGCDASTNGQAGSFSSISEEADGSCVWLSDDPIIDGFSVLFLTLESNSSEFFSGFETGQTTHWTTLDQNGEPNGTFETDVRVIGN